MKRIIDPAVFHKTCLEARAKGLSIGLVPTMGALHKGHLSLVRAARKENDCVGGTVFVNPTQFAPGEDLEKYPRDLEEDAAKCEAEGVDWLFAPRKEDMYPFGHLTHVEVAEITQTLCGTVRPTHFQGVTTVVLKLFNLAQPTRAYFGQKDAQQAIVIQRMVDDLHVPVEIRVLPIVREADGLAMSSRNVHLDPDQHKRALSLKKSLDHARSQYDTGVRNPNAVITSMKKILRNAEAEIDYVAIVNSQTLQPVSEMREGLLVAIAVRIGKTRLIDNCVL